MICHRSPALMGLYPPLPGNLSVYLLVDMLLFLHDNKFFFFFFRQRRPPAHSLRTHAEQLVTVIWHKAASPQVCYWLDHAVGGAHDLDLVGVVVEMAWVRREQLVHDGRVGGEVRPETHRQRFDLMHALHTITIHTCTQCFQLLRTDTLQHVMNAAARVVSDTRKFNRGLTQILHDDLH